ncbi:hypothetical protein ASE55_10670 [Chryseobacterium sp. Leaf201]|nr:hypothetical protein ASE55_10670 [Chryseobacterium sp. Leaf201]
MNKNNGDKNFVISLFIDKTKLLIRKLQTQTRKYNLLLKMNSAGFIFSIPINERGILIKSFKAF